MSDSLLPHALRLAEKGFWVFPLIPGGKTPAVSGWQQWATRDSAKIRNHWTLHPQHNVGVYCGKFGDDGGALIVVDVDCGGGKKGDESLAELAREGCTLPPTFTVHTPTGGRHFYYLTPHPMQSSVSKLAPNIDIKSSGGYIVGAGSRVVKSTLKKIRATGTYELVSDTLAARGLH